jgi:hypothetical protein
LILSILFDSSVKDNLWNTHRSSWMQVKDLFFVEKEMIPKLLKYINEMNRFCNDLSQTAVANSELESQKKELQAKGEVGINKNLPKKEVTRPISPKLTKPSPTILPEPIKIEQDVRAKPVPAQIYQTNLQEINEQKKQQREKIQQATLAKFSRPDDQFKFQETRSGAVKLEELKKEIQEKELKELQFNNSYYNPPPKVNSNDLELISNIKPNVSTILREDYLFRKLQTKDAQILKNYEEELRDPIEYYYWQEKMEKQDEIEKLKYVSLRREQAKQSSEEAKLALERQKEDNLLVANMMREQNEIIKKQKQLELEIETLTKQAVVREVIQERETKPYDALQDVLEKKKVESSDLRKQLEELRKQKKEEIAQEEMIKADRIRQLKALNTVHRKHVVVFDPTETAKIGLLDEMSYMEMKERLKNQKFKDTERVALKNEDISEEKEKKKTVLQSKYQTIIKNRQLKKESHQQMRQTKMQLEASEKLEREQYLEEQNALWKKEEQHRQEIKEKERQQLIAEQEKILRQQQYLGVASEQVALIRQKEIEKAQARQMKGVLREQAQERHAEKHVQEKEKLNKSVIYRNTVMEKEIKQKEIEKEIQSEKKQLIKRLKEDIVYKKDMFAEGQEQHEKTKTVVTKFNPYASRISNDLRIKASQSFREKFSDSQHK